MPRCPKCGDFIIFHDDLHRCDPRWLVWCEDYGGDIHNARTVNAPDAEHAAEIWAERDDAEGDYTIIRGDGVTVCVASKTEYNNGPWDDNDNDDNLSVPPWVTVHRFYVRGEAVATYYARTIDVEGSS